MRSIWKDMLTAVFMGMILPGLMVNFAVMYLDQQHIVPAVSQKVDQITVSLPMHLQHPDGTVEEMDTDTYLTGVVLAEMPASFEPEALKAQAVVARTYTQKAYFTGGKHGNQSVCTASACCQAYISEGAYFAKGGNQDDFQKVQNAVIQTSGKVLSYEGELIEATYFSCSGGRTEDAAAVWGTDYPYLQAVSSPGEENAAHYMDTVYFTLQEFQNALDTDLIGDPSGWFGAVTYTEGGGVATMDIGGKSYSGTKLRMLLGLNSTVFNAEVLENLICITTYGFGHRVGMSQYGAEAMAVTGSTYEEILHHYYPGTKLIQLGQ